MLLNHHNTEEKVKELIELGDLSCLYENLKPLSEAPVRSFWGEGQHPTIKESDHSFDNAQKDVTVPYHRDRGEAFNQRGDESLAEYSLNKEHQFEEYNYLWKDGQWFVRDNSNNWIILTAEIVKNDLPETE